MSSAQDPAPRPAVESPADLLVLATLSLLTGAVVGVIGAAFRRSLEWAEVFRGWLLERAQGVPVLGFVLFLAVCAVATGVAAWLVRRYAPHASGSGIPHVEAVLSEELPPAPSVLVPVKFAGGVLAIGSGLALGREGPSVQMGATAAHLLGRLFRRDAADCRVLLAAGAGAGLATAFNAPMAGAVFVLEELLRRFNIRVTIATFGASASAIAVGRLLLGDKPDFVDVPEGPYAGFGTVPIFLVLGLLAGVLGVLYNRVLLGTLTLMDWLRRIPVEVRAAVIGAAIGAVAWFAPIPHLVGGGDDLTHNAMKGEGTLGFLAGVFLLRLVMATVSYAAGTPGGLFAPLLVLGAQSGLFFGIVCSGWVPADVLTPASCAVIGTAAFFTAVVRSPVTGIILVTEMTTRFELLLPMLAACFVAMLVPTLLRDEPIYDSLRRRTLAIQIRAAISSDAAASK